MISKHKKSVFFVISAILIRFFYSYLTVATLSDLWYPGSNGFGVSYSAKKEIYASIVFLVISVFCSRRNHKSPFLESYITLLFVLYYIPINASFPINDASFSFFILSNLFFLLVVSLLTKPRCIQFKSNTRDDHELLNQTQTAGMTMLNMKSIRITMFFICLAFIAYKISYNGFSLSFAIDSDYVYQTRDAYVAYRESFTGSLLSYLLSLLTSLASIVAPVYLYLSLERGKVGPILIALLTILAQYSVSTGKGTLFFIFICFGVYFLVKRKREKFFCQFFLLAMVILLCALFIVFQIAGGFYLYFLFIRRTMYYPAWLNYQYYDFFSKGAKMFFSDSAILLQRIIKNPYDATCLELIGKAYFSGYNKAPNTGMFAEAYMQLGIAGVFLFPLFYNVILNYASRTYKGYGEAFSYVMAVHFVLTMTNVPIFRTDFVLSVVLFTVMLKVIPRMKL